MNLLKRWFCAISASSKNKPEKKKVCWLILGKLLGYILVMTDEEFTKTDELNAQDPNVLLEIIREFVIPHFRYFSSENQEKLKNSLTYYLLVDKEKLEWVFSSLYVPLEDDVAKIFYSLVWKELYGTDGPDPINPDDYEEDCSPDFINSVYFSAALEKKYNPHGERPSLSNVLARLKQHP